jgi:hypothetical protein
LVFSCRLFINNNGGIIKSKKTGVVIDLPELKLERNWIYNILYENENNEIINKDIIPNENFEKKDFNENTQFKIIECETNDDNIKTIDNNSNINDINNEKVNHEKINIKLERSEVERELTRFKVLSYKLLSKDSINVYKSEDYLIQWEYRKTILLKELLIHSSDIICVQELDSSEYKDFWDLEFQKSKNILLI